MSDIQEASDKSDTSSISLKKLEANRKNAQLSTGPRTATGKRYSRRNATGHALLASALLIKDGLRARIKLHSRNSGALCRDLQPTGQLEEAQVEEIATCLWRKAQALRCEAGAVKLSHVPSRRNGARGNSGTAGSSTLRLDPNLDRILRNEASIQK